MGGFNLWGPNLLFKSINPIICYCHGFHVFIDEDLEKYIVENYPLNKITMSDFINIFKPKENEYIHISSFDTIEYTVKKRSFDDIEYLKHIQHFISIQEIKLDETDRTPRF